MFIKYPRTRHLEGSRLQPGDSSSDQVKLSSLTDGTFVWEEKLDGANSAVSFDASGKMILQSRGHVLNGGAREAQFNMFKQWAAAHEEVLYLTLSDRYIMFGEWCYAKHTVFYDALTHYFYEFDIYDKTTGEWLDTPARHAMLKDTPVVSVPVVHVGKLDSIKAVKSYITPSLYKTPAWALNLVNQAISHDLDVDRILNETEPSNLAEGLYLKNEKNGVVIGRYKFVRADFHQTILDSGTHWAARPILPNKLADGIDIFTWIY